jgi:hypothetical protein
MIDSNKITQIFNDNQIVPNGVLCIGNSIIDENTLSILQSFGPIDIQPLLSEKHEFNDHVFKSIKNTQYNILHCDGKEDEYETLSGIMELLDQFNCIIVKVYPFSIIRQSKNIVDMDLLLIKKGFRRTYSILSDNGYAVYVL